MGWKDRTWGESLWERIFSGRKGILALILLFLLVGGGSFGLTRIVMRTFLAPSPQLTLTPTPIATLTPISTPTPTPIPSGIYLEPGFLEVKAGEQVTVKVEVKLTKIGISAGEIELRFDPAIMEAIALTPGNLLGDSPLIGLEMLDNSSGKVKYALARLGKTSPPTPPGIFAWIKFRIKDNVPAGEYKLKLSKTGLADQNFQDILGINLPIPETLIKVVGG